MLTDIISAMILRVFKEWEYLSYSVEKRNMIWLSFILYTSLLPFTAKVTNELNTHYNYQYKRYHNPALHYILPRNRNWSYHS